MRILKELFGFYVTHVRYAIQEQGVPESKAQRSLHDLIVRQTAKSEQEKAESLLIEVMGDYEEQGFINGFRFATAIWKEC